MWLWECELHAVGFRRRSDRYWQCERRFGLPQSAYLSIFEHAAFHVPERKRRTARHALEVSAFHVTFLVGVDHIHFYYHELDDYLWEPAGHTSNAEIRRHGVDPQILRDEADRIAEQVAHAFGGILK